MADDTVPRSRSHEGLDYCPVTGEKRTDKYLTSWTDRSLPDAPFNCCPRCDPTSEIARRGVGGRLRSLDDALRSIQRDPCAVCGRKLGSYWTTRLNATGDRQERIHPGCGQEEAPSGDDGS